MDAIVTGDTLGMHIAIALGVPAVVLFGSTVPQEVELYDKGAKIMATIGFTVRRSGEVTLRP